MNLVNLFDISLIARANAIALEWNGRQFTFGDIEARSNRVANALIERGFQKGDRLCVYLANSIELVDLFIACVKLGVIFVPVNILYRDREIAHILSDAEPRALIADSAVTTHVPVWTTAELLEQSARQPDIRPAVHLDGDTPAGIIYTSGTTGTSKGAVLSHNNFATNAVNLLACWQISRADRLLLALPLFHVHGLGNGLH